MEQIELMWICRGCETFDTFRVKKGTTKDEARIAMIELHKKTSPSCEGDTKDILIVNSFDGYDLVETSEFIAP